MARILIISNGHGEDISGARLASEMAIQGHDVSAFPFVGKGNAYMKKGIQTIGPKKEFSTGGMGYTSLFGRLIEIFEGQVFYLLNNILKLYFISEEFDFFVVVGDIIPIFAVWLTRKNAFIYLVAYSSHYEGRLTLPWPCQNLLKSKIFLKIYCRDQLTYDDLKKQTGKEVKFLGNPFMDSFMNYNSPIQENIVRESPFKIGLLPGSRRPELEKNLRRMLKVLCALDLKSFDASGVVFKVALSDSLQCFDCLQKLSTDGWLEVINSRTSHSVKITKNKINIELVNDSFEAILEKSDLIFSMSGTAAEQAVGLAKPVVQLPGEGPQFTSKFADAQRRLLGPTVFCVKESFFTKENDIFKETGDLIIRIYNSIKTDVEFISLCRYQAMIRIGELGASKRISDDIALSFIDQN